MSYPPYQPQQPVYGPPQAYGPPPGYAPPPAPPSPALTPAMRVDVIQGTPFGVAYPAAPTTPSGPSIGSLVAGIASILVALFALCLGATGASEGWGLAAAGAFTVLGIFLGAGAAGLGLAGTRQIRKAAAAGAAVSGRGMAITGIVLGCTGGGLAMFVIMLTFLLS
ncbi:hypothetical protein ABT369_38505 [Dactylosporangium sp. NPDC000244]|uniref:hypothetical protein n=1 Tax=Dactylosporangium sp. NPDC000244 TaxID=3154365 RepID=UPI00331920F4